MTILSLAQEIAEKLQLSTSMSTLIGNTSSDAKLLRRMIDEAIDDLKNAAEWPELEREHTFTLSDGVASYALPADMNWRIIKTSWNRSQQWPLIGPVSPQMWQQYKSGLITSLPRQRFRVKGWGINQLFIDPTPSSDDAGQTCVFEYASLTARRPKTWVANTSWTGIRYCSYNGYIFDRGSTGSATTGTDNAPTPDDLNDGTITWTLVEDEYTFQDDSDEVILDPRLIVKGAVWRFKRERELSFESFQAEAEEAIAEAVCDLKGAEPLTVSKRDNLYPVLGPWNYPDGGFGS